MKKNRHALKTTDDYSRSASRANRHIVSGRLKSIGPSSHRRCLAAFSEMIWKTLGTALGTRRVPNFN